VLLFFISMFLKGFAYSKSGIHETQDGEET
jgi:hypothetical protein